MRTILYCRVSTIEQRTDRQRINEKEYDLVIEDKVSGAVPFFVRDGGKQILNLVELNIVKCLHVVSIDRLGRNLRDILNTIHFFTEKGICIYFINHGLKTLDENGKQNPVSQLIISVLGIVGEMELTANKERQLEGIHLAKLRGVYKGRKEGTKEDVLKFLSKPKNKKALDYLKKGYTGTDVAKLTGLNVNSVGKVRKLGLPV